MNPAPPIDCSRRFVAHWHILPASQSSGTSSASASGSVAVVFSHNPGSCNTLAVLQAFKAAHPHAFDWVLRDPPPRLGMGFRNAQREASHHGISLGVRRWSPEFVLVHRPDALFQEANSLPRLARLLRAQPPPLDMPRGRGRLALGAGQTVLSEFYGLYHLDDHVSFGRAADVAAYWSADNPSYCRKCSYSTALPATIVQQRKRCFVPGPESELGETWVRWEHNRSGTPLPASTEALIAARLVVLDLATFGYVSVQHPSKHALAQTLTLRDLPLRPVGAFQYKTELIKRKEPFGAMSACARSATGTYNCTGANRVSKSARTMDWPCSSADDPSSQATKRYGGCLRAAKPPRVHPPASAQLEVLQETGLNRSDLCGVLRLSGRGILLRALRGAGVGTLGVRVTLVNLLRWCPLRRTRGPQGGKPPHSMQQRSTYRYDREGRERFFSAR